MSSTRPKRPRSPPASPRSLLHVDRAEIDLPPGTDPYSDAVYARRGRTSSSCSATASSCGRAAPASTFTSSRWARHRQRGLVAVCHVEDYDAGSSRSTRRRGGTRRTTGPGWSTPWGPTPGPIFLTYRDPRRLGALAAANGGGGAACTISPPPTASATRSGASREGRWIAGLRAPCRSPTSPTGIIGPRARPGSPGCGGSATRPHGRRGLQLVPVRPVSRPAN